MWAAGYSVEEIQRRGRWVSQCFRIYIWEGRERAKGVGSRMLKAKVSMFATMQPQANRDLREQAPRSIGARRRGGRCGRGRVGGFGSSGLRANCCMAMCAAEVICARTAALVARFPPSSRRQGPRSARAMMFQAPGGGAFWVFGSSAVLKLAHGKQHNLGRGAQRGVWQAPGAG